MLDLVTCPLCKTKVLPMTTGQCPSCRQAPQWKTGRVPPFRKVTPLYRDKDSSTLEKIRENVSAEKERQEHKTLFNQEKTKTLADQKAGPSKQIEQNEELMEFISDALSSAFNLFILLGIAGIVLKGASIRKVADWLFDPTMIVFVIIAGIFYAIGKR